MTAGRRDYSNAKWPDEDEMSVCSRGFDATDSSSTTLSSLRSLLSRKTPSPTLCSPNEVVIKLATSVVIPDYNRYFAPTPISSFQPMYMTLADGSLIAGPFIDDLKDANISLLVTGMLTMLFIRNIVVSGDYLRRGKVKRKTLFYLLFISQLLAPLCFIPDILPSFDRSISCKAVLTVSRVASYISLSILITGILGFKAYKCLDNSRFVFVSLGLFLCASAAVTILDLLVMQGVRRLSGSCTRTGGLLFIRIYLFLQFFESFFICLCFCYAIWKSHGFPAVRGRISIELSLDDPPYDANASVGESPPTRRGWWDYVPEKEKPTSDTTNQVQCSRNHKLLSIVWTKLSCSSHRERRQSQANLLRKPSVTAESPTQMPRLSTVRISESPPQRSHPRQENRGLFGRSSPAPSSLSRLSRFIPRMVLFRAVMKDELCYTTFITSTCVVVAILAVIGISFKNGLTVNGWISTNWGIISILAIHSFGRVVRRHEREAMLQNPATWDSAIRAEQATAEAYRQSRPRRPWTPISVASHRRLWRSPAISEREKRDDPFSDTHRMRRSQGSWNSASFVSSAVGPTSPSPAPSVVTLMQDPLQDVSVVLPSEFADDFPTSGHTTPLVRHDSSDGALVHSFVTVGSGPGTLNQGPVDVDVVNVS